MKRFILDERGATSVEYVVLGMCVFLVIVTSVGLIGDKLAVIFPIISAQLR